jgi:hypothetical protein
MHAAKYDACLCRPDAASISYDSIMHSSSSLKLVLMCIVHSDVADKSCSRVRVKSYRRQQRHYVIVELYNVHHSTSCMGSLQT